LLATGLPPSNKKQHQPLGDKCQLNPILLISRGLDPATLASSTLWWKGPQWFSQEPSSWHTTELNAPTENLEIKNVHVAILQTPDDIT
jgi:hypothetical protein